MEENGLKAVIYFLIFMTLVVRSLFVETSATQTQSRQISTPVSMPEKSR